MHFYLKGKPVDVLTSIINEKICQSKIVPQLIRKTLEEKGTWNPRCNGLFWNLNG